MSFWQGRNKTIAEVVKLVDTLRSGRSTRKGMEVRVLSSAHLGKFESPRAHTFVFLKYISYTYFGLVMMGGSYDRAKKSL